MATHVCRDHQLTSWHQRARRLKGQDEPCLLLEEGLLLSSMFFDLRCKGCPEGGSPRQLTHWRQEPAPTLTTNSEKHVSK